MGHCIPGIWAIFPEPIQNFRHPNQHNNQTIQFWFILLKRDSLFQKTNSQTDEKRFMGGGYFQTISAWFPFLWSNLNTTEIEHKFCHSFVWTQTKTLRTLWTQISTQRTLKKTNRLYWHKWKKTTTNETVFEFNKPHTFTPSKNWFGQSRFLESLVESPPDFINQMLLFCSLTSQPRTHK